MARPTPSCSPHDALRSSLRHSPTAHRRRDWCCQAQHERRRGRPRGSRRCRRLVSCSGITADPTGGRCARGRPGGHCRRHPARPHSRKNPKPIVDAGPIMESYGRRTKGGCRGRLCWRNNVGFPKNTTHEGVAMAIDDYRTATATLGALRHHEFPPPHRPRRTSHASRPTTAPSTLSPCGRSSARVRRRSGPTRALLRATPPRCWAAHDPEGIHPDGRSPPERRDAALQGHRPAIDGPVATRVFRAGAVPSGRPISRSRWEIGRRTARSMAHEQPLGCDEDPWGEYGGGGAALAAGTTPLEVGSDIGGSIRVPAAYCGVYGHRPSETAIPKAAWSPRSIYPIRRA